MKKLVIDRSKWVRGEGSDASKLIREEDGRMCCLGFLGLACGVSVEAMIGLYSPSSTYGRKGHRSTRHWPAWLAQPDYGNSGACGELMTTNDNKVDSAEVREARIAEIMGRHGWRVEFVDGPVSP